MLVGDEGNIYVERRHPAYPYVIDFLVSCCEPVSRTHHVEQYCMNHSSLSAATAEGTYTCDMMRYFLRYWQLRGPERSLVLDLGIVERLYRLAEECPEVEEEEESMNKKGYDPISALHAWKGAIASVGRPLTEREEEEASANAVLSPTVVTTSSSSFAMNAIIYLARKSWKACQKALQIGWLKREEREERVRNQKDNKTSPPRIISLGFKVNPLQQTALEPTTNSTNSSVSGPFAASLHALHTLPLIHLALNKEYRQAKRGDGHSDSARSGVEKADLAVGSPSTVLGIPTAVENMLREEEASTKVEVVLQPRLRRFHGFSSRSSAMSDTSATVGIRGGMHSSRSEDVLPAMVNPLQEAPTSTTPSSSYSPTLNNKGECSGDELAYFLISKDRKLLERIVEEVQEWLEPMWLGGTPRYVLSDVSRHLLTPPSALPGDSGKRTESGEDFGAVRARILQRLYVAEVAPRGDMPLLGLSGSGRHESTNASKSLNSSGGSGRMEFKSQIKRGALRQVREALFKKFSIRADCSYDYLRDVTPTPEENNNNNNNNSTHHNISRRSELNQEERGKANAPRVPFHVDRLELAAGVRLRPYQITSLDRFRRGQLAHQGVIVLPCGAGKTLTGIAAAATLKKRTIVMCVNHMSVFQWQREFLKWTNLNPEEVTVCTSKVKQLPGPVFITTYSMLVAKRPTRMDKNSNLEVKGAEAQRSEEILEAIQRETWGLLLLDEVHTALAHHFQEVLNKIQHKCVLGLSATLLREDDRIADLRHLVGPKLYEANWLDLTRAGFLAKVECAEIQCELPLPYWKKYQEIVNGDSFGDPIVGSLNRQKTPSSPNRRQRRRRRRRRFGSSSSSSSSNSYNSYSETDGSDSDEDGGGSSSSDDGNHGEGPPRRRHRRRGRGRARGGKRGGARGNNMMGPSQTVASCNPVKLWCAQALLHFHLRERSPPDKVIIFCDYLVDAHFYAHHLHVPLMMQAVSEVERRHLLQWFQYSTEVNALILTRVGDVALDIPNASVVIQISGLGASRRQEAQRLGRILRPKPPSLDQTCAYFYSLVSQDTHEIRTSYTRQSWLRDQGFSYRVLTAETVLQWYRYGEDRRGQLPSGTPHAVPLSVQRPLCCVGPPQWWYYVRPQEFERWKKNTKVSVSVSSSSSVSLDHVNATHGPLKLYKGMHWAPFSANDSIQLQSHFNRGVEKALPVQEGLPHLRFLLRLNSQQEKEADSLPTSWIVRFSSVDAPHSFGTVLPSLEDESADSALWNNAGDNGKRAGESRSASTMARRITFGPLDDNHCCLDAEHSTCIEFALSNISSKSKKG